MARYVDKSFWEEEVLIPDTNTPVLGGQPLWEGDRLVDGFYNVPIAILADRTRNLKNRVEGVENEVTERLEGFLVADENLADLEDIGQAKYNLGLNLVDNTPDISKPISNLTQAALDQKVDKEEGKGLSEANFTQAEKTQLSTLQDDLNSKVDKVEGYGLSQENYTSSEKSKLAGLESSKFKGEFVSLVSLESAYPSPEIGSYAFVDEGEGFEVVKYIWDSSDERWVLQQGESAALTPVEVKSLYESNADTNAFTDAEKSKLVGIQAGATNLTIGTTSSTAKAGNWQPTSATKEQVLEGTSTTDFVSSNSYSQVISWEDLGTYSSGMVTIDLLDSLNFKFSIGGNVTVESPQNSMLGKSGDIVITMTANGSVSWDSDWKFLTTVPDIGDSGEIWVISYKVLSSSQILASANKIAD